MFRWVREGVLLLALIGASSAATAVFAAGADDRAAAEASLKEVAASPRKDVAAELSSRAQAALDRGAKLRAAGDEAHAKIADALAKTWGQAARDVARAAHVEEQANSARRDALDAGVVAERERTLLEEAIAQSGRVRAELDTVRRSGKTEPAKTSASAASDAGAPRPSKTTPSAKPSVAPPTDGGVR
jgi:hypothetical protein